MGDTGFLNSRFFVAGMSAGAVFILATLLMGLLKADYNSVAQTVSEIGRVGSALRLPYALMLSVVGILSMAFALGLWRVCKNHGVSTVPAWLVGSFGLLDIGFAAFPSPMPMHNIIGLGHLFGYFAPVWAAIAWRNNEYLKSIAYCSFIASGLVIAGLILNLSPIVDPGLYPLEFYGVVQRTLLYSYFIWVILVAFLFARLEKQTIPPQSKTASV